MSQLFPTLILIFSGYIATIGLSVLLFAQATKRKVSSIRIMCFSINLILVGGMIAIDTKINLNGIEYLIMCIGLFISAIALLKND